MRREYEALSKLVGTNHAVLDDGTAVHLTPNGEIRDADNKILLPAFEGRADLYRRNDKGEVRAEAHSYQNMITDEARKPIWSDCPIVAKTVTVEHHGDFSKGTTGSPGSAGTAFEDGIFRYTKVSDLVPSMEQLFADDTTIQLYTAGSDTLWAQPEDTKYVFDGAYGRWAMKKYPYTIPHTHDGFLPYVLVVPESYKVAGKFDCYEPGIYMCAGSIGNKAGSPVLTYRDAVEITYPITPEFITGAELNETDNGKVLAVVDGAFKLTDAPSGGGSSPAILYMSSEYFSGVDETVAPPPCRDIGLTTAMTLNETMTALKNRAIIAGVEEGVEIGYFVPSIFVASDTAISIVVLNDNGIVMLIFNFS